jgi:creatinine amidohydrolase
VRYAELRPSELEKAIQEAPVAIWPVGALEWHGPHLPLGLDGIVAEAFAARLREKAGGVLLPCLWHPITTLPHRYSLDVPTETFRQTALSTANGLASAGFRLLCFVTGHYAQGHSLELFQLAAELRKTIAVIAASPLEPLEDDALLDHAAKWETAQLALLRPDLIDLQSLAETVSSKSAAVLGEDPRQGDARESEVKWDEAIDVWQAWIDDALHGEFRSLDAFYTRRKARYRPYVEAHYRESWEQAIRDWWAAQE